MTEFAGFAGFCGVAYASLYRYGELQQRRRVAAWQDRARRLRHMRGGT